MRWPSLRRRAAARRDPRVTAPSIGMRQYLLLFAACCLVTGANTGIIVLYMRWFPDAASWSSGPSMYFILVSLLAYLAVAALLVMLVFMLLRRRHLLEPVRRLGEAAREVAAGDFSVRLEPLRHDGRRDEFEVLFEDFNTMAAELASTELLKTDFVSTVSHELKTPLAVIGSYATMLQGDGLTDAERREYARTVADASQRLSVLVGDILELNRLEHQNVPVRHAPYNLSEQLSRCLLGFERVWEEKGIEIDADLDQDIVVDADEGLLDTVWNNLVSNALKFTDAGGSVTVRAWRDAGRVRVSVRDTGQGMDEAAARRAFERFYQADGSHATEGNGLGLALVRQVLDLVGGDVAVSSAPGVGSTFTVTLPG